MDFSVATNESFTLTGAAVPLHVQYQGRLQRGDTLMLMWDIGESPDDAPVATVRDSDDEVIAQIAMVSTTSAGTAFTARIRIGQGFSVGSFRVQTAGVFGGVASDGPAFSFDVIGGGDSGGAIISMFVSVRPEATYVVGQLDSGRLAVAKNPRI